MRKLIVLLNTLFAACILQAQVSMIDSYVNMAIQNNLELKNQSLDVEKSELAIQESKRLYAPNLSLDARYSLAHGGRTIELPVGDIINPVYVAIGDISEQIGIEPILPNDISNVDINFLRPQEHETKLSLVQPLFEPRWHLNYQLQSELSEMEEAEKEAYKQTLAADVHKAYYQYIAAGKVVDILSGSQELLVENKTISESLVRNGVATNEIVYRADAAISNLDAEMASAGSTVNTARAYFNMLLNRPLESEILIEENNQQAIAEWNLDAATSHALANRVELTQINHAVSITEQQGKLERAAYIPSLYGAMQYGFQGEKYSFTSEDDFWVGSIVLKWTFFDGLQAKSRMEQNEIDQQQILNSQEMLKDQIELQVANAYYEMEAASARIDGKKTEVESAQRTYDLLLSKYRQNTVPQIEVLDAETSLRTAKLELTLAETQHLIAISDFKKAIGAYDY